MSPWPACLCFSDTMLLAVHLSSITYQKPLEGAALLTNSNSDSSMGSTMFYDHSMSSTMFYHSMGSTMFYHSMGSTMFYEHSMGSTMFYDHYMGSTPFYDHYIGSTVL